MDFIIYSAGLLIGLFLIFVTIEHPYTSASILVFFYIYQLNMPLPGPLDARGFLTAILFARLFLFDKQNYLIVKKYLLQDLNSILLGIFILLSFWTTYSYYGGLLNLVKGSVLLIVSLILGFIIIINREGKKVFFNAIVLSGLLCTIDIIYSTIRYGSLHTRSLFKTIFLNNTMAWNHNAIGFICAIALILVYIYFIRKQISRKIALLLMFILSLGFVLSTSRSAIIAVVFVLPIILLVQKEIQFNINKILISSFGFILFFVSFYFVYHTLLTSGEFKSSFIDKTYYRLYEEPKSLFGGNETQVFDKWGNKIEGNTRWRINRAINDIATYSRSDLETKLFGLGIGGYGINRFGGDYLNAHNGYVLILVERGMIGLLIIFLVITNLSIRSFKLLRKKLINTPIVYVILTIAFYTIGQNSDLTTNLAFLLYGALIGNTKEHLIFETELEEKPTSANLTLNRV
jgi:hypothetical protein